MSRRVEIYTRAGCGYCVLAKRLLEDYGVPYEEHRIDRERGRRTEMVERCARHTVPQIFVDGQHLGDCDAIYARHQAGQLSTALGATSDQDPSQGDSDDER